MGKIKRKKRKKIDKKQVDFMKPITIDMFGTEDDPCFGKHYSPEAEECGLCGDCEICMIITSQNQSKNRERLEDTKNFLDLEEVSLDNKKVEKYIVKVIKKKGKVSFSLLCKNIRKKFDPTKLLKDHELKLAVKNIVKKSKKLRGVKNSKGKVYIKLKSKK